MSSETSIWTSYFLHRTLSLSGGPERAVGSQPDTLGPAVGSLDWLCSPILTLLFFSGSLHLQKLTVAQRRQHGSTNICLCHVVFPLSLLATRVSGRMNGEEAHTLSQPVSYCFPRAAASEYTDKEGGLNHRHFLPLSSGS